MGNIRRATLMLEVQRVNWFMQQRQDWIAERLRVYGFINREHLRRKFGISMPQASRDLQAFAREHRELITYDPSRKCYVAPADGVLL